LFHCGTPRVAEKCYPHTFKKSFPKTHRFLGIKWGAFAIFIS